MHMPLLPINLTPLPSPQAMQFISVMGDSETLAKARMELEDLYLGIPDDSVNLTFQNLAEVQLKASASYSKRTSPPPPLSKIPSLDFSKGLEAVKLQESHHLDHIRQGWHGRQSHHQHGAAERSMVSSYVDDVSVMSMMSGIGQQKRRPGIPHSNICTVCSTYIYIFRQRCLVCGRVYCRQCVGMGMGEMSEGRKCIQCLGRKFSQRYITRAGKVGCCSWWKYGNEVKQEELKWAEKGPRSSSRRRGTATGMSHSSFVACSSSTPTYSAYATPTHLHYPL